jgi:hypothetical protein
VHPRTLKATCKEFLPLEDVLQLVYLYFERGSPKAEPAARRWLVRYLSEAAPSLQDWLGSRRVSRGSSADPERPPRARELRADRGAGAGAGTRRASNYLCRPGDQEGSQLALGVRVRRRSPLPSAFTTQIWLSVRATNAIFRPSGDQAGALSGFGRTPSLRRLLPSAFMT